MNSMDVSCSSKAIEFTTLRISGVFNVDVVLFIIKTLFVLVVDHR